MRRGLARFPCQHKFLVKLPAPRTKTEQLATVPDAGTLKISRDRTRASILAVDDSASMRQMVAFTLKGAGYDVIEAIDGQDALSKARTQQADVVLTDLNMPNMDGDKKTEGKAAGATGWLATLKKVLG
jgi:two-component system chemotaxis response regulator CheY